MFQVSLNKIIGISLCTIAFSGCMKQTPIAQAPSAPAWYFENKQNTPLFIYGTGEGSTLEDAKTMALSAISSSIIVTISGEMTKKAKSSGNYYSQEVSSSIKSELSKITFPNPIVEKKEVIANRFYVLVKINKAQLRENIGEALQIEDNELKKQYQNAKTLPKLEHIYALKQIVEGTVSASNKANIVSSLDNSFELGTYLDTYSTYKTELTQAKQSLNISVIANENSRYFSDVVTTFLTQNGFKQNQKTTDVKIEIEAKPRYSNAQGWFIAKVSTNIKVYSNEKVLNALTIDSIGRSSSNNENALADAAAKFQSELNTKGIDSLLFQ